MWLLCLTIGAAIGWMAHGATVIEPTLSQDEKDTYDSGFAAGYSQAEHDMRSKHTGDIEFADKQLDKQ